MCQKRTDLRSVLQVVQHRNRIYLARQPCCMIVATWCKSGRTRVQRSIEGDTK
jgi:hypothetical protein